MDRGDKESKGNDDGAKGGEENRQGRRPRRERQEETASTKQNDEMYAQNQEQMNANGKPRRRRGAAEEEEEAADGKSGWMGSVQGPDDDEDAVNNGDKHFNDDDGEIILIPDMDEDEGMDADQRIVHAPRNVNRRVPTLIELENEVKVAIPTGENGLDISILTSTLVPAPLVVENDSCWTFDSLLRDVYAELNDTSNEFSEDVFTINNGEE